ncbi:MAG TPA: DUF2892 domain-containing protein [Clostridiales bacterium]|nr:DUF2892 domain-containing protein [Clostridiales bacterium]
MRFCLPATSIKVWLNTDQEVNDVVFETIISNIRYYAKKSRDEIIQRQLILDEEWDIDRVIETGTGAIVILGALLTWLTKNKSWALLSGIGGAFLLKHALYGWSPLLSCIRGEGVRTQTEIMAEKTLLEVLKEDPDYLTEDRIRDIVLSII